MPNRRRTHWAALLAVGLPLLISGCASTSARDGAPAAEQAAIANLNSLSLADKLRAEKNYSSAAAMYQQAHQSNPGDVRPLLGLGESFLAIGANIDATNAYSTALDIDGNNAEALFGLGKARLLLNQPELAVPVLQTATRVNPSDPRPMTALGVAFDKVGDHAAAQQSYKKVLSLDPNNRAALNNLALSLALSGDEAGAVKILEGLNSSATASSVVRQNLALIYGVNGQMEQSERLGRVDLPESSLQQNLTALRTTTSSSGKEALLKSSLGVELKGMQYSAAPQPSIISPSPAQLLLDETSTIAAAPTESADSVITIRTQRLSSSVTQPAKLATAKSVVTGDEWGDNWDEELVDASEVAPPTTVGASDQPAAQAPSIAAAPQPADMKLPAAPLPNDATENVASTNASAPKIAPNESSSNETDEATVPATAIPTEIAAASASQSESVSAPGKVVTIAPATATTAPEGMESASSAPTPTADVTAAKPSLVAENKTQPETAANSVTSTSIATSTEIGKAKVYAVQLAAYRSEAEATAGWTAIASGQGDLLNGLPHHVEKADLGTDKGIFFRLKAGSFGNIADARALCTDLKTRSVDCMVVEAASTPSSPTSTQSKQSALTPTDPIVIGARY